MGLGSNPAGKIGFTNWVPKVAGCRIFGLIDLKCFSSVGIRKVTCCGPTMRCRSSL